MHSRLVSSVRTATTFRKMSNSVTHEDDFHVIQGPKSSVPFLMDTIGRYIYGILKNAPKNSKAMIDVATNQTLLHSELLQKSVNLSEALRYHGYQGQNAILSICSENRTDYFVPILSSLFNGSIMAPLNPSYVAHELEHALMISSPRVIFCSEQYARKICELKDRKMPCIERVIVLNNSSSWEEGTIPSVAQTITHFIQDVLQGTDRDIHTFQPVDGDISKMAAFILCSSGTTGLPKGVTLSHQNMMTRLTHGRDPAYYSQNCNDQVLGFLPFFHAYGLSFTLGCICSLQTVVCLKRFEENLFLSTIQEYRINVLTLVPPLAIFLAKSEKVLKYDLSSVNDMFCCAAPLDGSIEEGLKKRLNCQSLRQALGMTETTATVTMIGLNGDSKAGSCGKVMSYISGKVRDPATGKSLGPFRIGELCWKGPLVMMGYYKDEKATRDAFTKDLWFKSGDLGYYDRQGFFYIVDRLKEIIKYKGYQIAPAELEAVLINHPKIEDAGVIGVPNELVGDLPLAFVVKKEGKEVDEEEIKTYVAGLVSPQKRLRGGVIFVKSIPKNPSGKILRRELRDLLKDCKAKNNIDSKL